MKPILPMVRRMSYAEYAAVDGVRWSHLAKIRDGSELHLRAYLDAGPDRDTDSTRRGRLLHTLLLEPDASSAYVVFDGRRQGKAWEVFAEEHVGKTILRPEDMDLARAMVDALRGSERTGPYLRAEGIAEGSVFWTDDATELPCKARPDWLILGEGRRGGVVLVDVKTARTLDERLFGIAANRLGYHAQLAHYRRGLRARGVVVEKVVVLGVENTRPHDTGSFILDDAALDLGDAILTETMGRYARALRTGRWPGRFAAEVPLSLPDYLFGDFDTE